MAEPPDETVDAATQKRNFAFDFAHQTRALDQSPEEAEAFARLLKSLRYGSKNQLIFCEFSLAVHRDELIGRINQVLDVAHLRHTTFRVTEATFTNFYALEDHLRNVRGMTGEYTSPQHDPNAPTVVHLLVDMDWFTAERVYHFNLAREAIVRSIGGRLLLWVTPATVMRFIENAPDLWSWRTGIFDFTQAARTEPRVLPVSISDTVQSSDSASATVIRWRPIVDDRSLPEKQEAIAQANEALTRLPNFDRARAQCLENLANLYASIGRTEEALRIRTEELLPVFETLGDVRERAETLGSIADIYEERGQLDEALRIRREEQLPIFAQLGDLYARAITMGKMADIFQARGQTAEALRIRFEDTLPIYEKIGVSPHHAMTKAKIARSLLDINGSSDEAARLLRQALIMFESMQLSEAELIRNWLAEAEAQLEQH